MAGVVVVAGEAGDDHRAPGGAEATPPPDVKAPDDGATIASGVHAPSAGQQRRQAG
jgi:hypothetical protein